MERADQSARHDKRMELDLSNPADDGTDAAKSGDTSGCREVARDRDQEWEVLVNPVFFARTLFPCVIQSEAKNPGFDDAEMLACAVVRVRRQASRKIRDSSLRSE